MATRKFTRVHRARSSKPKSPSISTTGLAETLDDLIARLEAVEATIITAHHALRQQNTDIDSSVAQVLQLHGSDALSRELDNLRALYVSGKPATVRS